MGSEEKPAQVKSFAQARLARSQGQAGQAGPVASRAQANELVPELCGLPYDYLFRDSGRAMAECSLLVWEYSGLDMLSANLDIYNFEAESAGARMIFYPDHIPSVDRSDYLVKGPDDLDKVRFGGLDSGRLPYLIEYHKAYTELSGLDSFPTFCAPWSLACNLYGLENLLEACLVDPDFAHELLRRCVDDLLGPMIAALAGVLPPPAAIAMADAWYGPPMASMQIMEEFEPYVARVGEAAGLGLGVASSGIWGYSHLKGPDLERLAALVARLGGALSAYDPDVMRIGPEFFRGYADKHGLRLSLGFSTDRLQSLQPEEVVTCVRRYVLVGKNGLTPFTFFFNNIAPHTPLQNIVAGVAAVATYGAPGATAETPFDMPEVEPFEGFLRRRMANNAAGYSFDWLERSRYAGLWV